MSDDRSDREILAEKIGLLLDAIRNPEGNVMNYQEIVAAFAARGIKMSRTRWHRLRTGSPDARLEPRLLSTLADVFDIDPRYLLERDGELPRKVEAELDVVKAFRLAEVKTFAARSLGNISPEALHELASVLEKHWNTLIGPA